MRAIAKNRIYIIGAGLTGLALAREIQAKPIFGRVVAFLDDDPQKIGRRLNGIPVLGPLDAVTELLKTTPADEAIIAIPGATREQLRRIHRLLTAAEFSRIRIVPQLSQLLSGEPHLIQARELNPEDLLARQPVRVDLKKSLAYLRGKRVLVTGAGGSIGSELARQLLYGGAERLYLFGHGENSIYEAERELRLLQEAGVGEKATIVPVIGELQDRDYVRYIVGRLRAHVVFHAAAHKHVPLMEANPVEAVKNNVFGTANLIDASPGGGGGALRAGFHGQGGGAGQRVRRLQADRRGAGAAPGGSRPGLPGGALRQRAGLPRQHPAAVRQADPEGRTGDPDPPGGQALLHDHPGGRQPGAAGRRGRAGPGACTCWTWASPC